MTRYTPPSECELCWPIVNHFDYATELSHEVDCRNRKDRT